MTRSYFIFLALTGLAFCTACTTATTLTWTGGGDGTTFTATGNWSGSPTGGVIDKANLVDDYVINDASAAISESGSYIINGGSISLAAGEIQRPGFQGFSGGPLNVSGGVVHQWFLSAGAAATLSGDGEIDLFGAGAAINNSGGDVTIDIIGADAGLTFLRKTANEVVSTYQGDIFIGGVPSVFGADPLVIELGDNALIVENAASGADNVTVFGTVVPEPSIFAFVALLAIPALYRHRRRARDS
ncbi:MAG: hypothetical protein QF577_09865 [Phycisphaerae bacterium]|nr:hypothetical protein [Phycisphaerae bacterium]